MCHRILFLEPGTVWLVEKSLDSVTYVISYGPEIPAFRLPCDSQPGTPDESLPENERSQSCRVVRKRQSLTVNSYEWIITADFQLLTIVSGCVLWLSFDLAQDAVCGYFVFFLCPFDFLRALLRITTQPLNFLYAFNCVSIQGGIGLFPLLSRHQQ